MSGMRAYLRVALVVLVCLLALNLPLTSAGGRRYKRRCDLAGCQRCYTSRPKNCYGRACQELYACEENKCGPGYTYNPGSGMCDCLPGYGILLGRCSYKAYRRMPGFSQYYVGKNGYNKLSDKPYIAKSNGYRPGYFGYRAGMYVSGPYCQPCFPVGGYSSGGEPMTTWCLPGGSLGSITVTPPTGKDEDFDVEVTFNVPGKCASLSGLDVLVVSTPAHISCEPAQLDDNCAAATTCKASKPGSFKLVAKLQGVGGVVTDSEEVEVPDVQPPVSATLLVSLSLDFDKVAPEQRPVLAQKVRDLLYEQLKSTGVTLTVTDIRKGSFEVVMEMGGTDEQVADATERLAAIWAEADPLIEAALTTLGFQPPDNQASLFLNGNQIPDPTTPGNPPPPPPFTTVRQLFTVTAVADVNTASLTDIERGALRVVVEQLVTLAAATLDLPVNAQLSIDSVSLASPSPTTTTVVVQASCNAAAAATVSIALGSVGDNNFIRASIFKAVKQLDATIVTPFQITITVARNR